MCSAELCQFVIDCLKYHQQQISELVKFDEEHQYIFACD